MEVIGAFLGVRRFLAGLELGGVSILLARWVVDFGGVVVRAAWREEEVLVGTLVVWPMAVWFVESWVVELGSGACGLFA